MILELFKISKWICQNIYTYSVKINIEFVNNNIALGTTNATTNGDWRKIQKIFMFWE